jgi:pyruvate,water dikinase
VGLFRAEFMIAGIGLHPRKAIEEHREQEYTEKLAEGMRQICTAFYPRPVVYRATDFKTNEYRNLQGGEKYEPKEENPMMGYRGCARYTSEPDAFKLEVDAIRKVREVYGLKNLWLMIPMVRTIEELRGVKKLLEQFGLKQNNDFKLWIMVEVPSTIFLAEEFCHEGIDGISIGSNDLTQFTLACDRDNSTLASKFDERNEAVLKALKHVIRVCNKHGVTTSICGQAPSVYPEYSEKLVEFGINSISVNPDMVDVTRKNVASAEKKLMLKKLIALTEKDEEFNF